MAPSGSQARASSPAMISPSASPSPSANLSANLSYHAVRTEFDFTSLSLFHACIAATALCAIIWAAIGYSLVG